MILTIPVLIFAIVIGFVKSSVKAACCLLGIFLITGHFELIPITAFLLFVSLLIPKPNPRHQTRRFQLGKSLYVLLIAYTTWVLSQHVSPPTLFVQTAQDLDLSIELLAPLSFFVFVIYMLFQRQHVH